MSTQSAQLDRALNLDRGKVSINGMSSTKSKAGRIQGERTINGQTQEHVVTSLAPSHAVAGAASSSSSSSSSSTSPSSSSSSAASSSSSSSISSTTPAVSSSHGVSRVTPARQGSSRLQDHHRAKATSSEGKGLVSDHVQKKKM